MNPFPLVVFILVIVGVIITVNFNVSFPIPCWPFPNNDSNATNGNAAVNNNDNTINAAVAANAAADPEAAAATAAAAPVRRVRVSYTAVPIAGVLLLLLGGAIGGDDVWAGLAGDNDIQPYTIMILFMALAYVCISLDFTGALAFVSLKVVAAAGSSKRRLFVAFFCLTGALTAFTSNDVVILTLTPVVVYCAHFAQTDAEPYIFTMFYAANLFSFFFIISNPTNIIVGEAVGLSFADFISYMLLPGFVTVLATLVALYLYFRSSLDGALAMPALDPAKELQSRRGALVHAATLGVCILFMCVSSLVPGVRLWMVALGAGIVSLVYNLFALPWRLPAGAPGSGRGGARGGHRAGAGDAHAQHGYVEFGDEQLQQPGHGGALGVIDLGGNSNSNINNSGLHSVVIGDASVSVTIRGADGGSGGSEVVVAGIEPKPQAHMPIVKALPWALMPFVFGMFCLVQALLVHGWIDEFARWCIGAMGGVDALRDSDGGAAPLVTSLFMMFVTIVLCNAANNQPATILLTRILISPRMKAMGPLAHRAAVLSVIAGSNISACFTTIGALAGIMFCGVLAIHKIEMSYGRFIKVGVISLPIALACALAITAVVAI